MTGSDGFRHGGGILRFHVSVDGGKVEAFLSQATCEAAVRRVAGACRLADFYRQHRSVLHDIVLGKVSAGARQPVVVMAADLHLPPPAPAAG